MTSTLLPHGLVLFSPDFRVKLVLPGPEDDKHIARLRSIPSVHKHMPFLPALTKDEATIQRELRSQDPSILDVAIYARATMLHEDDEDGESYSFAGVSGVFEINAEHLACEAGIIIAPEWQGKGLTTPVLYTLLKYMFEHRDMHRVHFETSAENVAMNGWLVKVARARLEGRRRKAWRSVGGSWVDVNGFVILDDEWDESVRRSLETNMGTKRVFL
ncbi:hypothetical protein D9611_011830 [Ephemerocybe angulata]|uniref:N-acetyltransferase domain-containing protein n=1 Tax=Ephemerocybe angulata TaxID=980116 RepID=A0A8H5BYH2_9AGAR|nr:hypothetical protein D9611_011830 [Tulosesus angulatus]